MQAVATSIKNERVFYIYIIDFVCYAFAVAVGSLLIILPCVFLALFFTRFILWLFMMALKKIFPDELGSEFCNHSCLTCSALLNCYERMFKILDKKYN